MATLYSTHYNNLYVASPKVEVESKDFSGKIRQIYVTYPIAATVANGDVIKLAKLPPSCKVIAAECVIPATGTTGIFSLGWSASADGSIAADADGFIVAADLDSGAGAVYGKMELNDSVAGLHLNFAKAVDIQLTCTEDVDTAATAKITITYISE